jgi:hypothetical protein
MNVINRYRRTSERKRGFRGSRLAGFGVRQMRAGECQFPAVVASRLERLSRTNGGCTTMLDIVSNPNIPDDRRSPCGTVLSSPKIRARQIKDSDLTAVANLLTRGFPRRTHSYWVQALGRLTSHPHPAGLPKYGYLLECDNRAVGVILLIFSAIQSGDQWTTRCNVSSWCVEPAFRSYAPLFINQAVMRKNITYVNISPATHTLPILEAQGFTRYSNGQFVSVPALSSALGGPRARIQKGDLRPDANFEDFEWKLLVTHAEYGCITLWCTTPERAYPFVFLPRIVKGCIPCTQLIYSRNIEDFVRFARQLGTFLALRGRPVVLIDSNGPIRGLAGTYRDGNSPKYFKGPPCPRLGDLAYTEAAMFGM